MYVTLKPKGSEEKGVFYYDTKNTYVTRSAYVNCDERRLVIVKWNESCLPQMLSHEYMHVLLREFVSDGASNWLDILENLQGKEKWLF